MAKTKQPGMVYTHCTAHRLELSMLDSIKFDNYLTTFNQNINNTFKFYYKSGTHRNELQDLPVI